MLGFGVFSQPPTQALHAPLAGNSGECSLLLDTVVPTQLLGVWWLLQSEVSDDPEK